MRGIEEACHITATSNLCIFWRGRRRQIIQLSIDFLRSTCVPAWDEMYFPRSFKGSVPVNRKSRHRGGCSKSASNEDQVGVLFAVDRQGHEVGAVLKDHKSASVRAVMDGRLENSCVRVWTADPLSSAMPSRADTSSRWRLLAGTSLPLILIITSRRWTPATAIFEPGWWNSMALPRSTWRFTLGGSAAYRPCSGMPHLWPGWEMASPPDSRWYRVNHFLQLSADYSADTI